MHGCPSTFSVIVHLRFDTVFTATFRPLVQPSFPDSKALAVRAVSEGPAARAPLAACGSAVCSGCTQGIRRVYRGIYTYHGPYFWLFSAKFGCEADAFQIPDSRFRIPVYGIPVQVSGIPVPVYGIPVPVYGIPVS